MSDVSANLSLPYILAAQAQKHVTHNEAIRALDAIVQLAVLDRDLAAPPASPAEGDRYIVADAPTGAWAGRAGDIAAFQDGAWAFISPREGWRAWLSDEAKLLVHDGAGWSAVAGEPAVNPASLVGVNAVADGVNRLAVKSDAVLFSHDDVTPGSGDMRLAINKADADGVASVVFQDAFSGRAEFGLAAGDLFELKVSTDGTVFTSALSIDPADGIVELPQGAVLAAGGVINWNDGAATLAEASGGLTVVAERLLLEKATESEDGTQMLVSNPSTDSSAGFAWMSGTAAVGGFGAVHADALTYMFTDAGGFMLIAEDELSLLSNSGAGVYFPDINTTAATTPLAILDASTGQLFRSTSTAAVKRDIEPMGRDRAHAIVEGFNAVWFRSRLPNDRQDWSWDGALAEEVAALDPRYVTWGYRDEDVERVPTGKVLGRQQHKRQPKQGAKLVPVGVAYERLSVPALVVLQDLKGLVAALQERVAALESR